MFPCKFTCFAHTGPSPSIYDDTCKLLHSNAIRWPPGLRHELSSGARTLGSWVQIPLKPLKSAFILFVLSCVGSGLATDWSPVWGVLPTVLGLRNWSETKRFTDALCSKVGPTGIEEEEEEEEDRVRRGTLLLSDTPIRVYRHLSERSVCFHC
jgi:hypothetical protein